MERTMTRANVIETVETQGMILAVLQLTSGDVALGMVLRDTGHKWRVAGISTSTAEAWQAGRRGVILQPLDASVAPAIGAELKELQ